jgi:AcrR family transcriptional regulator
VPRTADHRRPEELLGEIVAYLTKHGLADLSLRPLARAVRSSPRVLLYYFGSKEKLVVRVLAEIRRRQRVRFAALPAGTLQQDCWVVWKEMSAPASVPYFRLFFEAFGIALRKPRQYEGFLRATVEDWLDMVSEPLHRDGHTRGAGRALATIVVAGLRGFMFDFCATGDRKRIDRAVRAWLAMLRLGVT